VSLNKRIWASPTLSVAKPNREKGLRSSSNTISLCILLATSILALVPVWIPTYPPMADLPQHAAQVALLRDLQNPQFSYSALFRVNWFTPYLLGYLLIYALTPLFGIVAACKLIVSLFVAGLPLSTALLLRSADVDVFWAVLCIPGAYGFAYQWGFVNFLIAAPLGMIFLWLAMRPSTAQNLRTTVLLAGSAIGLFFCHALICAFFGTCAALCLIGKARSLKAAIVRVLPLTVVLPVAIIWVRRTLSNPSARRPMIWDLNWRDTVEPYYSSLSQEMHFSDVGWGRITGFFPRLFGVEPSWQYVVIGAVVFLLPFFAGMRLDNRPTHWASFLVCVAVLLWCPHAVFGTEFVYQRFTMFIVPLFLLLLRRSCVRTRTALAVRSITLALVVALIASAAQRSIAFSRETRGFQQAVSRMQPGERVLSLAFDHGDRVSIAPTFLHFPQWYTAQKLGIVDPSAAMMHPELVVYRAGHTPAAVLWDFEWDPDDFTWNEYSGAQYRYFIVRSEDDVGAALFSQASCAVNLSFHQGEWWLYERAAGCPATEKPLITRPQ
jgi:hypothetical protein